MSNYDPFPGKLPSISMLNQQENGHHHTHDISFPNFASNSDMYTGNVSSDTISDMPLDLYSQQHLSPPLTPAVSPYNVMDSTDFKRKYSVDVGPFGFNVHPLLMTDQDGYRRSSYSTMSVGDNMHQQHHSPQQDMVRLHHNQQQQQPNYYHPQTAHQDHSFLIGDSPSLSGDTDNAVSIAHDSLTINDDSSKLSRRTRPGQSHQQGPNTPHKHVCKYSECGWSFKRYEHLKRHMLVHTGERPHICVFPGCGKSFSRSDNFHAHYRTHTKKQAGRSEKDQSRSRSSNNLEFPSTDGRTSSSSSSQQQDLYHDYASSQSFVLNNSNCNNSNKSFEMPYPDTYDQQSFTSEVQDQYPSVTSPQPFMRVGMSSQGGVSSLLNHDQAPSMFTSNVMTSMYDYQEDYTGFPPATGMPPSSSSPISSPSTLANFGSSNGSINKKKRKCRTSLSHNNNANTNGNSMTVDGGMQQKSHVCPMAQCQRRFKRLEHLKRHMRIHTLERPFACTFPKCHKHFSRSDNLSQHMKTHQHRRSGQDKHRKSSTTTIGSAASSASSTSPRSIMDDFTSSNRPSIQRHSTNVMSELPSCWTLSESVGC